MPATGPIPGHEVHGLTHIGRVRNENQDHFLVASLGPSHRVHLSSLPEEQVPTEEKLAGPIDAVLFAVADGVGGGPRGEEASRTALSLLPGLIAEGLRSAPEMEDRAGMVAAALHRCHDQLIQMDEGHEDGHGMATTLTAWLEVAGDGYLLQAGDSRCYLLRNGVLRQLSIDQTMAQSLVEQGMIDSLDDAPLGWNDILTSAVGGESLHPAVSRYALKDGDVLLLCTDGLPKHRTFPEISTDLETVSTGKVEATCRRILEDVLEDGGTDNVAMVLSLVG